MSNINLDYSVLTIFDKEKGVSTFTYKDIGTSNIRFEEKNKVNYINDTNTSNINEAAVKASLTNLFGFIPGQRILDPNYGNSLYQFLYEEISTYTADKIGKTLRSMIANYEPRITVTDIEIVPENDDSSYYIVLKYIINGIGTNSSTILSMNSNTGISVT